MKNLFLIINCLFTFYSQAVPEHKVSEFANTFILNKENLLNIVTAKAFLGEESRRVSYAKIQFPNQDLNLSKGAIAISVGRNEGFIDYIELAHDFSKHGYFPAFVMEHRGQGYSEQLLPNPHKGHVNSFSYYVQDFKKFTNLVLEDKDVVFLLSQNKKPRLYSYSLGGLIASHYVHQFPDVYSAHSIISPLYKMKSFFGDSSLKAIAQLLCFVEHYCHNYVFGGTGYVPRKLPKNNHKESDISHSVPRLQVVNNIRKLYPSQKLGSVTNKWLINAIEASRKFRNELLVDLDSSNLILWGSGDTVVENLKRKKNSKYKQVVIPKAKHGILLESDNFRNEAFELIITHFNLYNE